MAEFKIMVTGCNGQLGRAIKQVYENDTNTQILGTDVPDLDITDLNAVRAYVRENVPNAIINCAAATNVDGCEKDTDLAYRINAIGPRNLAIAANENDIPLVHISTDYVFPGDGSRPYIEFDETAPKSAYGRTKLAGEHFVQQFAKRWYIVRTAWLYGEGKNFVRTMLSLAEKNDTIGVVDDQVGNPTSALELARAIKVLLPTDQYGIYHGTCEGICSWADFTEEIFRLKGVSTKVEHISSEEYKRRFPASADRPAYSALDNYMFRLNLDYRFADWKDALKEYLAD
ncbi:MAG: dTDP-4-dehydrorhamnose reductase [Lachnospiraceae bacterium]|jgi:dTDP-4-dehydrorhamnose reductase|nr:dTDP-4-dehydrorhamnose reductase [Lachnospiraceae bacterium]MBP3297895.1 dTDP-4-dehydrorhamnose reductase [Lachnospiraceae bacterium]